MGHAGNYSWRKRWAEDKIEMMKSADITISKSPADIENSFLKNLMVDF